MAVGTRAGPARDRPDISRSPPHFVFSRAHEAGRVRSPRQQLRGIREGITGWVRRSPRPGCRPRHRLWKPNPASGFPAPITSLRYAPDAFQKRNQRGRSRAWHAVSLWWFSMAFSWPSTSPPHPRNTEPLATGTSGRPCRACVGPKVKRAVWETARHRWRERRAGVALRSALGGKHVGVFGSVVIRNRRGAVLPGAARRAPALPFIGSLCPRLFRRAARVLATCRPQWLRRCQGLSGSR